MSIFHISLIVFSLVLLLTKSKILACKRQFVEERYKAAFVNNQKPGIIHIWFHAMWTCPMCSGFWISLLVCLFYPIYNIVADTLIVFGINWLLHCIENILFHKGKLLEKNFSETS
jgi:hypothetical protein